MTMGQAPYSPGQEIAYWKRIIRHAAIRAERKYRRWGKEQLSLNVSVDDEGDEFVNLLTSESAGRALLDSELRMVLSELPEREQAIMERIYLNGNTQREIAADLHISQSEVSRLHRKALQHLRKGTMDEMHSGTNS